MCDSEVGKIDWEYAVLWCVIIFFAVLAGWANTSRCYWVDTYKEQCISTRNWFDDVSRYRTLLEESKIETIKALCEVEKLKMSLELIGKKDNVKAKAIKALLGLKDGDDD